MSTSTAPRRPIPWRLIAFVVLLVVGIVAGAVWDWFNWHPIDAIVLTLGAVLLLVLGGVLAIARRRARTLGVLLLVLGGGIVVGQVLGPSRPDLVHRDGSATVALISPKTTEGNALASCATSDGSELQLTVDQNLRLDIVDDDPSIPADIDQREFFGASLTIGDRWRVRGEPRPDRAELLVIVGSVVADVPEARYVSTPTSTLEVDWTNTRGTLRFSGLQRVAGAEGSGAPLDLTGTIDWTC